MAAMVTLPKPNELARLQSASGADYQITPEDAETLVRMGVFEGGDPAYTLWAIAQRWVLFRDAYAKKAAANKWRTREYAHSLTWLVQRFSQPLNPDWRRDGEFCKPGGKYHAQAACDAAALERRDIAAFSTLDVVQSRNPQAFDTSIAWLKAEIPNPVPRAVNFSVEPVALHYLQNTSGARELARSPKDTCPACNVFITEAAARTWPENFVWLRAPNGAVTTAPLQTFAQGLWEGFTSWWHLA